MQQTLDLTTKSCPETFLFTKLYLEDCESGAVVEVQYANRETAERVRTSLLLEGVEASVFAANDSKEGADSCWLRITAS